MNIDEVVSLLREGVSVESGFEEALAEDEDETNENN